MGKGANGPGANGLRGRSSNYPLTIPMQIPMFGIDHNPKCVGKITRTDVESSNF